MLRFGFQKARTVVGLEVAHYCRPTKTQERKFTHTKTARKKKRILTSAQGRGRRRPFQDPCLDSRGNTRYTYNPGFRRRPDLDRVSIYSEERII